MGGTVRGGESSVPLIESQPPLIGDRGFESIELRSGDLFKRGQSRLILLVTGDQQAAHHKAGGKHERTRGGGAPGWLSHTPEFVAR